MTPQVKGQAAKECAPKHRDCERICNCIDYCPNWQMVTDDMGNYYVRVEGTR